MFNANKVHVVNCTLAIPMIYSHQFVWVGVGAGRGVINKDELIHDAGFSLYIFFKWESMRVTKRHQVTLKIMIARLSLLCQTEIESDYNVFILFYIIENFLPYLIPWKNNNDDDKNNNNTSSSSNNNKRIVNYCT